MANDRRREELAEWLLASIGSDGKHAENAFYHYVERGLGYCFDVISGDIPASELTILAAKRQLSDLERSKTEAFPYYFDPMAALKPALFIEQLEHIKGKWAGTPVVLEPWQLFLVTTTFGWRRKDDGRRRFLTTYFEVPRKNAKSTLSSGVALYMLACDGEGGAECYSAATTRDQARIVFNDAQAMARRSKEFRRRFGVYVSAHAITQASSNSILKPLAADANNLDGLSVHFACLDELHAHKTSEVYDVLETARGARAQPIIWQITTAGSNREGVCYATRDYTVRLLRGEVTDETFFGVIWTIDADDDWQTVEAMRKANPNLGVSIYPDYLESMVNKAKQKPSDQIAYLQKHLNVWTSTDSGLFNMVKWYAAGETPEELPDFTGRKCWIGLDLASKRDMTALVALFQDDAGKLYPVGRYYMPEGAVTAGEVGRSSQFAQWAREGLLQLTPGEATDFEFILEDLRDFCSRYDVQGIAIDPWQATHLINLGLKEGMPVIEYRMTVANMSEPTKTLDAKIVEGTLANTGDKILTWCLGNVVGHYDAKENVYPKKERDAAKIDAAISLIMALGLWTQEKYAGPNPWENSGYAGPWR